MPGTRIGRLSLGVPNKTARRPAKLASVSGLCELIQRRPAVNLRTAEITLPRAVQIAISSEAALHSTTSELRGGLPTMVGPVIGDEIGIDCMGWMYAQLAHRSTIDIPN